MTRFLKNERRWTIAAPMPEHQVQRTVINGLTASMGILVTFGFGFPDNKGGVREILTVRTGWDEMESPKYFPQNRSYLDPRVSLGVALRISKCPLHLRRCDAVRLFCERHIEDHTICLGDVNQSCHHTTSTFFNLQASWQRLTPCNPLHIQQCSRIVSS